MNIVLRLSTAFARAIYPILERWITVDPIEKRDAGLLSAFIERGLPGLNFANDADYLIYKQGVVILTLMIAIACVLALDALLSMGLLMDIERFQSEPRSLAVSFRDLSVIPWIVVTVIFYIRIRLSLDLSSDDIPVNIHPSYCDTPSTYADEKKSDWVSRPLFIVLPIMVLIFFSHIFVFGVVRYLSAEQNMPVIFSSIIFLAVGLSTASLLTVLNLIMMEKAYKYFPDLARQFFKMSQQRKLTNNRSNLN